MAPLILVNFTISQHYGYTLVIIRIIRDMKGLFPNQLKLLRLVF